VSRDTKEEGGEEKYEWESEQRYQGGGGYEDEWEREQRYQRGGRRGEDEWEREQRYQGGGDMKTSGNVSRVPRRAERRR
jgi:hypothetical protein